MNAYKTYLIENTSILFIFLKRKLRHTGLRDMPVAYAMTSAVVTLKNFRVKLSKSDVIEGHWFLMIR